MPTTEIVVGLDDSPSAKAALRWAARHARITRSALRVVHVDVTRRYDEMEHAHRASITAVFDEIQPPGDWLLQFASGAAPADASLDRPSSAGTAQECSGMLRTGRNGRAWVRQNLEYRVVLRNTGDLLDRGVAT